MNSKKNTHHHSVLHPSNTREHPLHVIVAVDPLRLFPILQLSFLYVLPQRRNCFVSRGVKQPYHVCQLFLQFKFGRRVHQVQQDLGIHRTGRDAAAARPGQIKSVGIADGCRALPFCRLGCCFVRTAVAVELYVHSPQKRRKFAFGSVGSLLVVQQLSVDTQRPRRAPSRIIFLHSARQKYPEVSGRTK